MANPSLHILRTTQSLTSLKWIQWSLASRVCNCISLTSLSTQLLLMGQQLLGGVFGEQFNFTHEPNNISYITGTPLCHVWPHSGLTNATLSAFLWSKEANALVNWFGEVSVWERHVFLAHSLGFHADPADTVQIRLTLRRSSYPLIWSLACNVTRSDGFPAIVKQDKTKSSHLS